MKARIEHNFQQASLTYAKCDDIQQKASRMLVNQMKFVCPNIIPAKILDVGCGTGNVIEALYDLCPNATYHINDISAAMLTETSKRFTDQIHFKKFHGDIECLNIGHSYDLVISNLCLQWVDDLSLVIEKILKHTKIFVFSCLLEDSFKAWYDLLNAYGIEYAIRTYPSQKEVCELALVKGHSVLHSSQNYYEKSVETAKEGAKYFKNLGANTPRSISIDTAKVSTFLKTHQETCSLRYNIGYFIMAGQV